MQIGRPQPKRTSKQMETRCLTIDRSKTEPTSPHDLSNADLAVVVELQRAELDRLLRENARLHERVSQLISLQEREQVLRQQLQTMMGDPERTPEPLMLTDNAAQASKARAAEHRYERLKDALGLLLTAIERQQSTKTTPTSD